MHNQNIINKIAEIINAIHIQANLSQKLIKTSESQSKEIRVINKIMDNTQSNVIAVVE